MHIAITCVSNQSSSYSANGYEIDGFHNHNYILVDMHLLTMCVCKCTWGPEVYSIITLLYKCKVHKKITEKQRNPSPCIVWYSVRAHKTTDTHVSSTENIFFANSREPCMEINFFSLFSFEYVRWNYIEFLLVFGIIIFNVGIIHHFFTQKHLQW